jgi:hypothetical protein
MGDERREADDPAALAEPGDYLEQLTDYEERLARGEIRWLSPPEPHASAAARRDRPPDTSLPAGH